MDSLNTVWTSLISRGEVWYLIIIYYETIHDLFKLMTQGPETCTIDPASSYNYNMLISSVANRSAGDGRSLFSPSGNLARKNSWRYGVSFLTCMHRRNSRGGGQRGDGPPKLRKVGYSNLYPPPKLSAPRRNVVTPPPPPPIINAELRHCLYGLFVKL